MEFLVVDPSVVKPSEVARAAGMPPGQVVTLRRNSWGSLRSVGGVRVVEGRSSAGGAHVIPWAYWR